jgi:hypothetical protein
MSYINFKFLFVVGDHIRMRYAENVACMRDMRDAHKTLRRKPQSKKENHSGDCDIEGRKRLKLIVKRA